VHHGVDGVLQLENLSLHVHSDLARQVTTRDGRRYLRNVTHLTSQVRRHRVNRVSKVFPSAGHTRHDRLTAQLSFTTHLTRHASYFRGEGTQLIHHRVDGLFQLQNLTAHVHCDLARQVAVCDGDGDLRDVAHLPGQVAGHGVDAIGEVLPSSSDAGHSSLA